MSGLAAPRTSTSASIAALIDPAADVDYRQSAARRLGLPVRSPVRAVAVAGLRTAGGRARVDVPAGQPGLALHWTSLAPGVLASIVPSAATAACNAALPLCAGIGPAGPLLDLPSSLEGALASLRFTAAGSRVDPGPRVVRFDDLGALVLMAGAGLALHGANPDLDRLAVARDTAEWTMRTMVAIASSHSLRDAAKALYLHHSTLSERVTVLERILGHSLRSGAGRSRLDVALAVDRLRRNEDLATAVRGEGRS